MRNALLGLIAFSALVVGTFGAAFGATPAAALPTPGLNCQTSGTPLSSLLRYIPEPEQTNDFVGYFEAKQCFEAMNRAFPDRMELKYIGKSYGHINALNQQREPQDVIIVEVTNEKSAIPFEDKVKVVLMLSIHGNEKGGREGGFRLLEDFVRNMGSARLPAAGHPGKTLFDLLDFSAFILLFPNPDGWVHDEPQYFLPKPGTFYERTNGRGTDLNRQLPTTGWQFINEGSGRTAMKEPEPRAYAPALRNYTNVAYAADIHGMLNPADGCAYGVCGFTQNAAPTGENVYGHFILGLLSAGQVNPKEMLRSTRLANLLKDRLNSNPMFAAWSSVPSTSVWGGEFYSWSTVWDTIGYTDSGISGDWFLQDTGLNAPGMNFEMAYNHITFDSVYPAAAQLMNMWHTETVRQIGRTYLEAAVTNVQTAIEAHGQATAYLYNPKIFSSETDKPLDGWALTNEADDLWDYAHVPYTAAPNDYFRELRPFMKSGDQPAVFDELKRNELTAERLAPYDNLVIAGSAIEQVAGDAGAIAALKAFVEGGGNLVLTDQSLKLMEDLGVVAPGSVDMFLKYAGMTLLIDRAHDFAKFSQKLSRQTYESVPIGYRIGGAAPVWYVDDEKLKAAGGEIVGVVPKDGSTLNSQQNPTGNAAPLVIEPNLGRVKVGQGQISFLGALLPDPSQEYYHPYGLDSYATTYFGNLLLYNMLGAEQVFEEPPIVLEKVGELRPAAQANATVEAEAAVGKESGDTPGFGAFAAFLALVAVVAVVARRRP